MPLPSQAAAHRVRRAVARLGAIVAIAAASAAVHAARTGDADTRTGTVVAVHDGDTISVRTANETIRVRLVGIDCPEVGQPWSARAKRFTSDLVFGKQVTIERHGTDRYDRLLGRVLVDGTDVNEALVRNGLAWQYEFAAHDPVLAEAERAARAARVGLWGDPDPIPPWRWRRAHPYERRR